MSQFKADLPSVEGAQWFPALTYSATALMLSPLFLLRSSCLLPFPPWNPPSFSGEATFLHALTLISFRQDAAFAHRNSLESDSCDLD